MKLGLENIEKFPFVFFKHFTYLTINNLIEKIMNRLIQNENRDHPIPIIRPINLLS